MTLAVLSLGSNMGDSRALLERAVDGLRPHLRAVSSVYRTPPWGPVDQDDFLNIIAIAEDRHADANRWLARAHELEQAAHRTRPIRWGPRTLDVDVIAVRATDAPGAAEIVSDDAVLTLPHPRAHQRAFVLIPWFEVEPGAVLTGHGPIADLLAATDTTGIDKVGRLDL